MQPRSKYDRLVFTDQLAEAGLTLMLEARRFATSDFQRAIGIRNGLMLTTLALCPISPEEFRRAGDRLYVPRPQRQLVDHLAQAGNQIKEAAGRAAAS